MNHREDNRGPQSWEAGLCRCAGWFYVNLIQARAVSVKGDSVEEMPPLHQIRLYTSLKGIFLISN